jgi:hypothetical protein
MLSIQFNSAAQVQHARTQETANSTPQADSYWQRIPPYHPASNIKHSAPESIPRLHSHRGALSDSTYEPPPNFSHDPPNIFSTPSSEWDWENDPLSSSLPPPRPPFLTPHSLNQGINAVSVPRSPTRVKFSPAPHTKPLHPYCPPQPFSHPVDSNRNNCDHNPVSSGASLKDSSATFDTHRSESCYSHESESVYSQESALSSSKDERRLAIIMSDQDKPVSTYKHSDPTSELNSSLLEDRSGARTVVDHSELRNPRTPYHAPATTPHLPSTRTGASQTKSQITKDEMESPLVLLPPPSRLFFRKRPKPLVLSPTPTVVPVRLAPEPALSSTDSTPPATPTSLSSASRQLQSPSPMKNTALRTFHRMTPPTSNPPNSPLPTPPTSPSYDAPYSSMLAGRPRTLRSAQSTTELRDLRDLRVERRKLSSAHGTTSSALVSGIHFPGNDSGRRDNLRPATATYPVRFFVLVCTTATDLCLEAIER